MTALVVPARVQVAGERKHRGHGVLADRVSIHADGARKAYAAAAKPVFRELVTLY